MLDLIFLTSSRVKRENVLRHVRGKGIRLLPPPEYGKPYVEPRILDRDRLLVESVLDANVRLLDSGIKANEGDASEGRYSDLRELALRLQSRLFFVEDTSVIIEAFSGKDEVPGVDVKYWMRETTFDFLDRKLKKSGKGRKVKVRSDIVLYIPPYLRHLTDGNYYKVFTGISEGEITKNDVVKFTNPLYPWLDNKTFNKWFVPNGESLPISLLPIDRADRYDFRKFALEKMEAFLRDAGLLYFPGKFAAAEQLDLLPSDALVVCGRTCSGKTTLAEFLSEKFGFYHLEASDFMHVAYYEKHGVGSDVAIHDFALDALTNDPSVVSARLSSFLINKSLKDFVVTGFRAPSEIDFFVDKFRHARFFYIDAGAEIRKLRSSDRGRGDSFEERERIEEEMGVLGFLNMPVFSLVKNEASIEEYVERFSENFLSRGVRNEFDFPNEYNLTGGLREAIILALFLQEGRQAYSTAQIAELINENITRFSDRYGAEFVTSKNNVSRFFHMNFEPYFSYGGDRARYEIKLSNTGRSEARLLINKIRNK